MAELNMTPPDELRTLAHRIAEGRLPVSEALRYAMQVGECLRKLHDAGEAHGAVTPANIYLTESGAGLIAVEDEEAKRAITPYTAPEVLLGRPAETRTDIFSFGAVLYEMLTGRKAFEGEGRNTLAANLAGAPTPSSGSPAADRVIGPCLAKNPEARTPRMQKILMELKLLSVAARRAEAAAGTSKKETESAVLRGEMQAFESRIAARLAAQEQRVAEMQRAATELTNSATQALHNEFAQVEAQIAARLAAHEETVTEIQRSATDALGSLKEQLGALSAELTAVQESLASRPSENELSERILSRVDLGFDAAGEHIERIEKTVEELRNHTGHFERSVAADLVDLEQHVKANTAGLEAARTAMAQTDDLVERVVEALESLQTAILDQGTNSEHSTFAVN